jgi:aspartyl-tRNA(Asn)/glutamyl-tRNA(Gln) amidotransferase subunit A
MAHAALGTDTGGSCRIPAAWCGLVGFKPTARRTPREGAIPLSTTLDSVGPLARSVACCAALDAILAGTADAPLAELDLSSLRIGVISNVALDGIQDAVADAFGAALERLGQQGARIATIEVPAFDRIAPLSSKGGFPAAEAYAWHRDLLAERGADYDPRVSVRIRRGTEQDAADFVELLAGRAALVAEAESQLAAYDAIALPTTPILPPRLADLETDDALYGQANLLALRNPTLINMIDGCAISLPVSAPPDPPVGLMLASIAGRDRHLLAVAKAIEAALQR